MDINSFEKANRRTAAAVDKSRRNVASAKAYAAERAQVLQGKLFYRGYNLEVRRAASGWRVGIYPRTADLPILSHCEVAALDQDEAVVMAKDRVDGVISL